MKKLLGRQKKDDGALVNKTVQVGQYQVRVEALLGQGGYADIYRVRDAGTGQTFALKHLRLQGDAEHITEVQKEAKTMAKLRGHPNVLRLHAVAFAGPKGGETDGFFLMDFCPGTLIAAMHRANYNMEDAMIVHVFSCVAQGVAHMHRQSPPMAHRDLKAENVLQLADGNWVLCDFGSATTRAQVYATTQDMAAEEEVIRKHTTPAYRAPEMWDLLNRQLIDTKVDIWALGVMLFVLAFGKLPFQGDSKLQILYGKYEMPQLPARPTLMRSLIRHMLAVDPAERPDIEAVLFQLNALRQELGMPALPTPAPEDLRRPSPLAAAAAAAAAPPPVPTAAMPAAAPLSSGAQATPAAVAQPQQVQAVAAAPAVPPGGSFFASTAAAGPATPAVPAASRHSSGQLRVNSDGGSSGSSSLTSSRQPSTAAAADRGSSASSSAPVQHRFSNEYNWDPDFAEQEPAGPASTAAAAPATAAAAAAAAAAPMPAASGSGPTPQQQQQLSRIMQRAAQAADKRQPPSPPQQQLRAVSAPGMSTPAASSTAAQAPGSSRHPLPQHSSSARSSMSTSATASETAAAAAAAGTRPPLSLSISNKRSSQGGGSAGPASPGKARDQAGRQQQTPAPQPLASPPPQQQQQQQQAATVGSLREEVLSEVGLLSGQVASLADHNKALVFRIKQLEEEVMEQRKGMAALQAAVRQLQGRASSSDGGGGGGGVPGFATPAAPAVANGYYPSISSGGAGGEQQQGVGGGGGGGHSDGGARGSGGSGSGSFWNHFVPAGGADASRPGPLRSHQLHISPGRQEDLV